MPTLAPHDIASKTPVPAPGESEADYVIRAHQWLLPIVPNAEERNAAVLGAWRRSTGPSAREELARNRYPDDEFVRVRDVPVFTEHEYVDRHGRTQKYGLAEMKAVCDRCNYRIDNTGNFAVLTEGHTPTKEQLAAGVPMPAVLGYAGPFRLGMVGNVDPKWAILQDEHHHRDVAERIRRMPTRSPEVWLTEKMNERFMDPIALLGAETPRLDMGMRYARTDDGQEVERYAAAGVVSFPSAASTFVPGMTGGSGHPKEQPEKERNSMADTGSPIASLSDEDIAKIVGGIMQTDVMQWCKQQMEQAMAGGDSEMGDDGMGDMGPGAPGMNDGDADNMPGGEALNDNDADNVGQPPAPAPQAPPPTPNPTMAQPQDDKKDKYSSIAEKERYAKLEAEKAELEAKLAEIQKEKDRSERYAKLHELRMTHAFDVEKEIERVSDYSESQFLKHCEAIVENYSRIPIGATIHVPPAIAEREMKTQQEREQYSRKVTERAMSLVATERAKGNHGVTYEHCLAQAREEIGSPGTQGAVKVG